MSVRLLAADAGTVRLPRPRSGTGRQTGHDSGMELLRARRTLVHGCVIGVTAAIAGHALGQTGFVNWETGHVSPLAMTPDGTRLLAVNTAAGTVEVFDISGASGPELPMQVVQPKPTRLKPIASSDFCRPAFSR